MKKIFITSLLCCLGAFVWGEEIHITNQVFPQEVSFAQPFDIHLDIAHSLNLTPKLDTASFPADFSIIREQVTPLSPGTSSYDISVMPFTLGVSTFTAVNVLLTDKQGKTVAQAPLDTHQITVKPVKLFKDKTLRDIRPPYIPGGWIWWLICLLLAILIIYVAHRFWRTTKTRSLLSTEAPDNRPADVIALSKLDFLLQSGLFEQKQYKMFYTELDNILREYFWRRFQLDVSADTSTELLRHAKKVEELIPFVQRLRSYVQSADLVKFAKAVPSTQDMQQDVSTVQTIVKQTAPRPTPLATQEDR